MLRTSGSSAGGFCAPPTPAPADFWAVAPVWELGLPFVSGGGAGAAAEDGAEKSEGEALRTPAPRRGRLSRSAAWRRISARSRGCDRPLRNPLSIVARTARRPSSLISP